MQTLESKLITVGQYSTLMADVIRYEGNLLHVRVKLDDELSLEILKVHNEKTLQFIGSGVFDVLFDVREVSLLKVPNKVLRYWAEPNEYSQYVGKMAILVKSRVHMQLANFYTRIFQPVNPSKFFTDETNALNWISGL
ncbi:MAG: hypothetical protein ACRC3B_15355 [Bacteroidia bacterium]